MANKKRTTRRVLPANTNSFISWPAGDAALKSALAHPMPPKDMVNSRESEKMLRDILK
jgi:hypothetical protein